MKLAIGGKYQIAKHQVVWLDKVRQRTCNAVLIHDEPGGKQIVIELYDISITHARHFVRLAERYSCLPANAKPDVYISRKRVRIWNAVQQKAFKQALREEARYQDIKKKTGKKTADLLRKWGIFKDYARRSR